MAGVTKVVSPSAWISTAAGVASSISPPPLEPLRLSLLPRCLVLVMMGMTVAVAVVTRQAAGEAEGKVVQTLLWEGKRLARAWA